MKKKVAIIGSGVAGLVLANLLRTNSNFEFVVYEKGKFINLDEGFGIQLSVNSVSILNKIGFDQINKDEKYHPLKLDFHSIGCDKICDLDLTKFNSTNIRYTTLKRSVLVNFLKEKLLSNSIIFGKKISDVKQIEGKLNIHFFDGSSDKVDYLVISDGIFSSTKSIIEKKFIKPNYYGAIAVRRQIQNKEISKINTSNISLIMGSDVHLVLYPVNQQKVINLVCLIRTKSENNDSNSIREILENSIFKQNKNLVNLFRGDLKSWPIYVTNKFIKSVYKNVFYAGDAFYTFPPTMAQGASQAIESANEIFNLISINHADMQNEYFKNRLGRINLINKRSKFNYFGFHISNPFVKFLRNQILKLLVKNESFINNYLGKVFK